MIEATKVYRDGAGEWRSLDVQLQYSRPMYLDKAIERVKAGGTVFVRREDAEAVLWEARGSSGDAQKHAS
jgi:hypothetical protein